MILSDLFFVHLLSSCREATLAIGIEMHGVNGSIVIVPRDQQRGGLHGEHRGSLSCFREPLYQEDLSSRGVLGRFHRGFGGFNGVSLVPVG